MTMLERPAGAQSRVVTGLASIAGAGGFSAQGPTAVVVTGSKNYVLSMGLGNNPAVRATFGADAAELGTLLTGRFGGGHTVLADVAGAEAGADWDGGPYSNPGGIIRDGSRVVVADAGANTLASVSNKGTVSPITTFGTRMVPTPPFLPPA